MTVSSTSALSTIFAALPAEIKLALMGVTSVNVLMVGADPATKKQAVMDLVNDAMLGVEAVASQEYAAQVAALQPDINKVVDGLTGIFITRKIFGFAPVPTPVTAGTAAAAQSAVARQAVVGK